VDEPERSRSFWRRNACRSPKRCTASAMSRNRASRKHSSEPSAARRRPTEALCGEDVLMKCARPKLSPSDRLQTDG